MNYQHDIFISFPHVSVNLSDNNRKWLENFSKSLGRLLERQLGRDVNLLTSLDFNSSTEKSLDRAEEKTAILLIILAEDNLNSQELERLSTQFTQSLNENSSNSRRWFKIIKSNLSYEKHVQIVSEATGFDFSEFEEVLIGDYQVNGSTNYNIEHDQKFWARLFDLSYEIIKSIRAVEEDNQTDGDSDARKTIYLAETQKNQRRNRDEIKRELQNQGYKVYSNNFQFEDATKFRSEVEQNLAQCTLSIHIIGNENDDSAVLDETSPVILVNKIAADYFEVNKKIRPNFSRYIWISPDLKFSSEKQKLSIEQFKRDQVALRGAEVIHTPLEIFKTIILNKMIEIIESNNDTDPAKDRKKIYFIYDRIDKENISKLSDILTQKGFNLVCSQFGGDEVQLINEHRKNIVDCDGTIIYYGNCHEQWVKSKLKDIIKAPGFGRKSPLSAKALVNATTIPLANKLVASNDFVVLENVNDISVEFLNPFLEKLQ